MGRLTQAAGARRYLPAWLKANASLHKGNRHDERRLDGSTHMMTQSHQMTDLAKNQNVPR